MKLEFLGLRLSSVFKAPWGDSKMRPSFTTGPLNLATNSCQSLVHEILCVKVCVYKLLHSFKGFPP